MPTYEELFGDFSLDPCCCDCKHVKRRQYRGGEAVWLCTKHYNQTIEKPETYVCSDWTQNFKT